MPGKFGKAEQSIQHLVAEIAGRSISDGICSPLNEPWAASLNRQTMSGGQGTPFILELDAMSPWT